MLTVKRDRSARALRTQTLAQGVALLLALAAVQRLVGFVRGVLFCRWLNADQLGRWDLAYGFIMFAAPLAVLGLPGSLGRYAEVFRRRGRLRAFLRYIAGCSLALAATAGGLTLLGQDRLSQFVFGDRDQAWLVALLAGGLSLWMIHTLLTSVFNALRMTRDVALFQFCHSLAFAALGCLLVTASGPTAESVVWAFGGACLVAVVLGFFWLGRAWSLLHETPAISNSESNTDRPRIIAFACWMWITNVLANVFGFADRWMFIRFSGLAEAEALAVIGQYHSARLAPLLFLGIAEMLAGLITPHLAHDWEAGRRKEVSQRLNLILKLFAAGLYLAAVGVLIVAPLMFNSVWAGKFAAGLSLLPWTLTYCIWGSLAVVATNYLWCAERARLASVALIIGLAINVGLNALLVPRWGIFGAVQATAAANLAMLAAMYAAACRCGMTFDAGFCVVALAPVVMVFGPWPGLAMLFTLLWFACRGELVLNQSEKAALIKVVTTYLGAAGVSLARRVGRAHQVPPS